MNDVFDYPVNDEFIYDDRPGPGPGVPAVRNVGSKEVIENYSDLLQWLNDPVSGKKIDARHTKDIVLANLDQHEMNLFRDFLEFSRELQMYGCLKRAKLHFIATAFDIIITSNAKRGFARRLNHTSRSESSATFERREEPMSKTGLWGKKR